MRRWIRSLSDWFSRQVVAPDPSESPCQLTPVWVLVGYDPATGRTWGLPDIAALGAEQRKQLNERLLLALATLAPSRGTAPVMSEAEIAARRAEITRLYPESK